ncbi:MULTISPECIES: rhodanese-like domain-containing protein [Marinobacter]|uniref:rhodanese-like domain-containing protein n=1 Tax=Marinobacter TaxID=2742 RepID=UPI000DAECBAB|nr:MULTISPECIES: rhodanese-like domain-containing protein [Marinobacter]
MERVFEFVVNHYILASIFVVLLIALLLLETRRGGKKVNAQALINLLNKDQAVVVDIRDRKDFANGHISGSIHMPLNNLKDRAAELKKHEGKQVVIVDKMGQHSASAVRQLNAEGYTDVVRLGGGIADWQGNNLPLKKKKK